MIFYSKHNSYRKEEFQLFTTVEKINDKLISSKTLTNPKAQIFLHSLIEKYLYLKKNNFSCKIVEPKLIESNKVTFDYKNGVTFDNLLFQCVLQNDSDKF